MNAAREDLIFTSDVRFNDIVSWSDETESGDLAELPFVYPEWSEISAHPDTCRGSECRYFEQCFFYKAKRAAEEASLILVNHALFFSDLAVHTTEATSSLLPDYSMIVFDEAHHLESAASQALGMTMTSARVSSVLKRLRRVGSNFGIDDTKLQSIERETASLFSSYASIGRSEFIVEEVTPDLSWAQDRCEIAAESLLGVIQDLKSVDTMFDQLKKERVEGLLRQTSRLREEISTVFHLDEPNYMRWGASSKFRDGSSFVAINLTPIDIGPSLHRSLWQREEVSAALVSATLATNGNFEYLKHRLGLKLEANAHNESESDVPTADIQTIEVIADSPFNYPENCLLYIARHLPLPNDSPDYATLLTYEITQLLYSSNGGAFLLFTSHRMLQHVFRVLVDSGLPFPLFRQGDMPNGRLVDEFRSSKDGVLFGTQSFWEGVDVPGDSLRLVVVDRLPFGSPESPMHKARVNAITAAGGDWFKEFALPQAQLKLKQGFGRLIRNSTDRGVVAILDSRLIKKNYGQDFLRYLPPARRTFFLDEVQAFFEPAPVVAASVDLDTAE